MLIDNIIVICGFLFLIYIFIQARKGVKESEKLHKSILSSLDKLAETAQKTTTKK